MLNLNNKIYSNNNNLLLGIINDLQQINNITNDNLVIKRIGDIIIKMNFIINENKKNTDLIINHISLLQNQMNKKFDELKFNQIESQQINNDNGDKYIGQVVNGLPEGKGILYLNNGDRYEGDFRNGKAEGKGIFYFNREPFKGDRYEGDLKNDKFEGKGIYYYNDGDRYEGDFKNDKREGKGINYFNNGNIYQGDYRNDYAEGKGIYYYNNGDRMMGDYSNNKSVGKHIMLTKYGEVKTLNY